MPARLISIFAPLAVGILFLLLWQGICYFWHIPPYLMPAPSDIARSLFSNIDAEISRKGCTSG